MILGSRYEGKRFDSTAKAIRVSQHLVASLDKSEILYISVVSAYGTQRKFCSGRGPDPQPSPAGVSCSALCKALHKAEVLPARTVIRLAAI